MLSVWWIVGTSCCTEMKLEGTFLSRSPSVNHRESLCRRHPLQLLVGSRTAADETDELLFRAIARRGTAYLVLWSQALGLCVLFVFVTGN